MGMIDLLRCIKGNHSIVTITAPCGDHYHATKLCQHCGVLIEMSRPLDVEEITAIELEGKPLQ